MSVSRWSEIETLLATVIYNETGRNPCDTPGHRFSSLFAWSSSVDLFSRSRPAGAQFAKLNFLISYLVAQDDSAPSWNPGDFFSEKFRRTLK